MRLFIGWCGVIILSLTVAVCFVAATQQYGPWGLLVLAVGYPIGGLYGWFVMGGWCSR